MKKTTYLIIAIITILILAFAFSQTAFGVGQMTKPIVIEDVLRGQDFTETLTLLNAGEEEVSYDLIAEGDIKDWTSFYEISDKNLENPITQIQVPADSYLDARVKIKIPEDIPNGEYSGQLFVSFVPERKTEAGQTIATVAQKIGREVLITVTDREIIDFDTAIIPLTYDVKRGDSLKIKIIYENKGNVFIEPDVQLRITKSGSTIFNAIFPYPENEEPVKSKTRKEIPLIEWQTGGQGNGKYKAEIKVLYNGEVMKEDDFKFNVGFTMDKLLVMVASIGKGNVVFGWLVIGGAFLVLAAILNFIYQRGRASKRKLKNNPGRNPSSLKPRKGKASSLLPSVPKVRRKRTVNSIRIKSKNK